MYITRPATESDIPDITSLGRRLWDLHGTFDKEYYQLENNFPDLFSLWVKEQLYTSYQFIIVAVDSNTNKTVGFISGFLKALFPWFKTKTVGHISYLIIDQEYRRKKIGGQLEEAALNWFKSKNIKHIELYVEEKNEIGISAWGSYGYLPFKKFLKKGIGLSSPVDISDA